MTNFGGIGKETLLQAMNGTLALIVTVDDGNGEQCSERILGVFGSLDDAVTAVLFYADIEPQSESPLIFPPHYAESLRATPDGWRFELNSLGRYRIRKKPLRLFPQWELLRQLIKQR